MMPSAAIVLPGTEFNDFLFAPIGEDRNGMPVSVLSGLARLDLDPWQEAARLAQSPGETATKRLVLLIGTLHDQESAYPDPHSIAARLIALLPQRGGFNNRSHSAPKSISPTANPKPWWVYAILMSFVLGTQFVVASRQLPTKTDSVQTSSSAASPQDPPAHTGQ
jgi:hypothetical protein